MRLIYFGHIHSHLSYSILVWGSTAKQSVLAKLQKLQNVCIKIIKPNLNLKESFAELKILMINKLLDNELCKFFYKLVNNLFSIKLAEFVLSDSKGHNLRKTHCYMTRQKHLPNLPAVHDPHNKLYNCLPDCVKKSTKSVQFCKETERISSYLKM